MLLNAVNVNKTYGAQVVLRGVSFELHSGQRVGVVGANGTGKTTLLRILAAMETPDSGEVSRARGLRLGYLEQEPALDPGLSVYQAALAAFDDLRGLEQRLRDLEREIAEAGGARRASLTRAHGDLLERFERSGGYDHESRVRATLAGVGFAPGALNRPVEKLSGGERSRVALARLLLRDPDALLLDEPTNHLDLAGVEWLEQFLLRYRGGAVIVSHDRWFLDRVATSIVELAGAAAESFPGNYSRYVEIRAARRLERMRAFEKQQDFIAREEDFIRRYGAGQRAKEARGRQTRLNRVERLERPPEERSVRIRFHVERPSGEICFRVRGLGHGFGGRRLFEKLSFDLNQGDRMGIVGPNGCGKSTLIKILMGHFAPAEGDVRQGHNLRIGYYDQFQGGLDPNRSALDEVWEAKRGLNEVEVRDLLALCRVSGDDALKRVADLSGGEKGRVALAKLIVQAPNILVLDEPTHHLDIPSREALEEALAQYDGTILVVSHDRFFLNRATSRTLVFEPPAVRVIEGPYEMYERLRARQEAPAAPAPPAAAPRPAKPAPPKRPAISKNRFAQLEARIIELEEEMAAIDAKLLQPETYANGAKAREMTERRKRVEAELAELNAQWEQAAETL